MSLCHSKTQLWSFLIGEGNAAGLEEKDKKSKDSKKAQKVLGTLGWDMTCTLIHFDLAMPAAVFQEGMVLAQEQDARKKRTEALFKSQLRVEALKGLPHVATRSLGVLRSQCCQNILD